MTYRDIVYDQLRCRNRQIDAAYEDIMNSYAELLDCVVYMRSHVKRPDSADKAGCSTGEAEREKERLIEAQLLELQQERAELYKRKGETAEAMLELKKKYECMEKERLEVLKELEAMRSKVAALENDNERLKESMEELDRLNQCLRDESFVLQSTSNVLEQNNRKLTIENAQLLERWKTLNQREANLLNLQNELQTEIQSLKVQRQLADAAKPFLDLEIAQQVLPTQPVSQSCHCATLPSLRKAHFEAHDGEVLALAWAHDRDLLATGGADRRLKLWYISDGLPLLISAI